MLYYNNFLTSKRRWITINLLAAIIVFNILIAIYQAIIEIFSAIFRIEGIQLDKARFQTISILTGTGFTTSESEIMLSTKRRRKLTQTMILFSYIFNISIVSTIINVFVSSSNTSTKEIIIGVFLTITNLILLIILNKSTRVRRIVDNTIQKISNKYGRRRTNPISIYDYYGDKVIAEISINQINEKMKKLNIEKLKNEKNIQLLVIKRGNDVITEVDTDLEIRKNDILLVFGNLKQIKGIFKIKTRK